MKGRFQETILILAILIFCFCSESILAQSNAWNVELVGQIGGACNAVFVQRNYAYIGEGSNLTILDISDPSNPEPMGKVLLPGIVYGVYVSGNHAYVADKYEGLRIVDVSIPSSPREVGYYDTPGWARSVYVSGNYAYLADGSGLSIIDISNPAAAFQCGYYETPSGAPLYVDDIEVYLPPYELAPSGDVTVADPRWTLYEIEVQRLGSSLV